MGFRPCWEAIMLTPRCYNSSVRALQGWVFGASPADRGTANAVVVYWREGQFGALSAAGGQRLKRFILRLSNAGGLISS